MAEGLRIGDDLHEVRRRVHRYWFEDGIPEVLTGILFLLLSAHFMLGHTGASGILRVLGAILLISYALSLQRLAMALKSRITAPRTGYVSYRKSVPVRRFVTVGVSVGFAAAVVWGTVILRGRAALPASAWLPLFAGLCIGVAYLYLADRLGLLRFYALAILSAVLGTLVAIGPVAPGYEIVVFFAGLGAAAIASGLVTFCSYWLKTRPTPGEPS